MRPSAIFSAVLIIVFLANSPSFKVHASEKPQIKSGFDLLYRLKFDEARRQFTDGLQEDRENPLGYVALSACYLFEEFYIQRVLTSEFFLDDERLLGGIRGKPDEGRKSNFLAANQKGRELALKQLGANPHDADALFALTIATGMRADFAAILDRRMMESLSLIKEAEGYANKLLVLRPDVADAWVSLGAANYIIGSLPAYKRFVLWFGRISGDKTRGMEQLHIAAEKGYYLKPFAEIFLALAALREGQEGLARNLLSDLAGSYPENPLFREELARLDNHPANLNNGGQ
jgi:hypothetical protein